ncbi:hypothetical protein PF006_g26489 [Phytophthora fragariae]|uniref:Uncharacterized protein n=1 Tax=Phytophthora fragariae TaxID=53985 RepID=A0A6A3QVY8_9STRA|nr:hypothetical protein PF006_g26489 [Phytophthora fragariae]
MLQKSDASEALLVSIVVAFATPKTLPKPVDVATPAGQRTNRRRLRRCCSSRTTLRRCWPRRLWRSPRRRLSPSPSTWRHQQDSGRIGGDCDDAAEVGRL